MKDVEDALGIWCFFTTLFLNIVLLVTWCRNDFWQSLRTLPNLVCAQAVLSFLTISSNVGIVLMDGSCLQQTYRCFLEKLTITLAKLSFSLAVFNLTVLTVLIHAQRTRKWQPGSRCSAMLIIMALFATSMALSFFTFPVYTTPEQPRFLSEKETFYLVFYILFLFIVPAFIVIHQLSSSILRCSSTLVMMATLCVLSLALLAPLAIYTISDRPKLISENSKFHLSFYFILLLIHSVPAIFLVCYLLSLGLHCFAMLVVVAFIVLSKTFMSPLISYTIPNNPRLLSDNVDEIARIHLSFYNIVQFLAPTIVFLNRLVSIGVHTLRGGNIEVQQTKNGVLSARFGLWLVDMFINTISLVIFVYFSHMILTLDKITLNYACSVVQIKWLVVIVGFLIFWMTFKGLQGSESGQKILDV